MLPRSFQLGPGDVPVRPALPGDHAQILPKFLHGRSAEVPIAIIDLVDDKTRFKHNDVRDHRIVLRISVLGDVQLLLNDAARIGEERPVRADTAPILVGLGDIVG